MKKEYAPEEAKKLIMEKLSENRTYKLQDIREYLDARLENMTYSEFGGCIRQLVLGNQIMPVRRGEYKRFSVEDLSLRERVLNSTPLKRKEILMIMSFGHTEKLCKHCKKVSMIFQKENTKKLGWNLIQSREKMSPHLT